MSHPDEHVLVLEPDHASRAFDLLLRQHKNLVRLPAFVRSLAAGAQLAEHTSFAVIVGGSTLDAAEGVTLDRWGEIVGEFRGGLDHEDYLRFIGLRIRVNTENPSTDAMWSVLDTAVDPSTVTSYLVADGIVYQVASSEFLPASVAAHTGALVRDFRPMGIYAAVGETIGNGFEFGDLADAGVGTLLGTIADPGDEVVGRLIYSGRG